MITQRRPSFRWITATAVLIATLSCSNSDAPASQADSPATAAQPGPASPAKPAQAAEPPRDARLDSKRIGVEFPLVARTESGNEYRLLDAEFVITGPEEVVLNVTVAQHPILRQALLPGNYTLIIRGGDGGPPFLNSVIGLPLKETVRIDFTVIE